MQPIHLRLGVVVDADSIEGLSQLIGQIVRRLNQDNASEVRKMTPKEASQHAIFAGKKPPTDRGLLVDSHEVAKLLTVSERTIYKMYTNGEMPSPIRIGRAVRWSLEELQDWIRAGCTKTKSESNESKKSDRQAPPKDKSYKGKRSGLSELYIELGLNPDEFPNLSPREIIQIAGDAADAFRNWTCGVPMTANGTNKLRERLRRFAESATAKKKMQE